MSGLVAVAGGTGSLGRTIVEAIVADGKFEVVILARTHDEQKEKEIGARIITADYTNVEALSKVLDDNKIHTVISALNVVSSPEPELNLIAAADRSAATKRYVSSIWAPDYPEVFAKDLPLIQSKFEITDALASTKLEHTSWYTGFFADYYIAPHMKTYLSMMCFVVDVANNTAAIPGSGDVPVAFTYTFDVAKFVAASLTLPKWEPKTYIIGDKLTWNQVLALAEKVKGVKFNVTTDTVEDMKAGKVTDLPSHEAMYAFFPPELLRGIMAIFGVLFDAGALDMNPEHTIEQDFPDIKLRNMEELMTEAWKGK